MLRFLTPIASVGFALALPILLLYLLKLRRRDTLVSSTFLWRKVVQDAEANTPWQKLRRNILLLLQLFILAALVITLMRPYTIFATVSSGKTVLLIDASSSMNAHDINGETRFANAKRRALSIVEALGADDSLMLIRVAALPEIILPFSDNREQLRSAIQSLTPGAGRVDWDSALALAAANRNLEAAAEKIVILSDGGFGEISALPGLNTLEWEYIPIGESAENVAISQLASSRLANSPPQLFASLKNHGNQEAERIVSIWLDGQLNFSERVRIAAGADLPLIYELPDDSHRELELRLTVPLGASTADYLKEDDRAFASLNAKARPRVLLISQSSEGAEANPFLERALGSLSRLETFRGNASMGIPTDSFDLTILDGWLPEKDLPSGDLLVINPPRGSDLFELGAWQTEPQVLRADASHPVGQFVDLSNVNLLRARAIFTSDNWAEPVLWADETPFLYVGESKRRQIAVLSIDLRDSDLPLWIAWPILVANLMEWFQPTRNLASENSLTSADFAVFQPPVTADSARITLPDGQELRYPIVGAVFSFPETLQVGIYRLDWLAMETTLRTEFFAVNLFAPTESEIRPRVGNPLSNLPLPTDTSDSLGQREWWSLATATALSLLLLEWWLYHRRNRSPRQPAKSHLPSEAA